MNLDSLPRLLDFLRCLSKEEFVAENKTYTPPKNFIVSDYFFRSYTCPVGCGGCCKAVSLLYFPHNIGHLLKYYPELKRDLFERMINVNGRRNVMYELRNTTDKFCRFLQQEDKSCKIHKAHPLLCRFELKKFIRRKDSIFFTKRVPGRGWLFNAQCKMTPFSKQVLKQDILELYELEMIADAFGIKNNIGRLVEALQFRGGGTIRWSR